MCEYFLLVLNLPRLKKELDPEKSLLTANLDKSQKEYLHRLGKNREWLEERILARHEALKWSGENFMQTNNFGNPEFGSGRALAFSYTANYACILFPVAEMEVTLAVDAEKELSNEDACPIKNMFLRSGYKSANMATRGEITRLWTITETLFKISPNMANFYNNMERLFKKLVMPYKFSMDAPATKIYFRSIRYKSLWISFAIATQLQPKIKFYYLP